LPETHDIRFSSSRLPGACPRPFWSGVPGGRTGGGCRWKAHGGLSGLVCLRGRWVAGESLGALERITALTRKPVVRNLAGHAGVRENVSGGFCTSRQRRTGRPFFLLRRSGRGDAFQVDEAARHRYG